MNLTRANPIKEKVSWKVRDVLEEMEQIGVNCIHTENGTRIAVYSFPNIASDLTFVKRIQGRNVCRRIYCTVFVTSRTKDLSTLTPYVMEICKDWDSSVPMLAEYAIQAFLPERVMNEFLCSNGGINHYLTVTQYLYLINTFMREEN